MSTGVYVSLSVTLPQSDPEALVRSVEAMTRIATGFAVEGHDAHISISKVDLDEDEDDVPEARS